MDSKGLLFAVFETVLKVCVTIIVVVAIYRASMFCYDYGYRIFMEPAVSAGEGRAVTVVITEDMTPTEMGETFLRKGLIEDPKLFVLQYYFSEFREDIQPGVFELSTAMTVEEMMEVMATPQEEEES